MRVHLEHCALVRTAAKPSRPVENVPRKRQAPVRILSVATSEVLEHSVSSAVCVDLEHGSREITATKPSCPVEYVARQRQIRGGPRPVVRKRGEVLEHTVIRSIGFHSEHCSPSRPVKRAAAQREPAARIGLLDADNEFLEHGIAGAVRVQLEHRPSAAGATSPCRSVKYPVDQCQAGLRLPSIAWKPGEVPE